METRLVATAEYIELIRVSLVYLDLSLFCVLCACM